MIEGPLLPCIDIDIERQYVDSNAHSEVTFAVPALFSFDPLSRLKAVTSQKCYRTGGDKPH